MTGHQGLRNRTRSRERGALICVSEFNLPSQASSRGYERTPRRSLDDSINHLPAYSGERHGHHSKIRRL
jgi:hypothetical protein